MIVTPDEIRPAMGGLYRHRRTGRVAVLRRYSCNRRRDVRAYTPWTPNVVRLVGDDGWEWLGCQADFWAEWIHAGAMDEGLN